MINTFLIFCATALLVMPVLRFGSVNLGIGDVCVATALIVMAIFHRTGFFLIYRRTQIWIISGLFLVSGFFLSSLLSGGNMLATTGGIIQYLFIIFFLPAFFLPLRNRDSVYYGYIIGIVLCILIPIIAKNLGLLLGVWEVGGRMSGLTGNPNTFAKILAMAFIFFLHISFKISKWKKIIGFLGVVLCLIGVILSASFAGIAALIIGGVVYLLYLKKIKLIIFLLIFLFLPELFYTNDLLQRGFEKITTRASSFQSDPSLSSLGSYELKMQRNQEALQWIAKNPLIGLGIQDDADLGSTIRVHNWFLIVYEEGGVLSFLGAIGMVISLFLFAWQRWKYCCSGTRALALASFIVFLLNAQTNTQMNGRFWWVGVFIVLSIINDEALKNKSLLR